MRKEIEFKGVKLVATSSLVNGGASCSDCACEKESLEGLCTSARNTYFGMGETSVCIVDNIIWVKAEDQPKAKPASIQSPTQAVKDYPSNKVQDIQVGVKYDNDKIRYSLVPAYALQEVARNLTVALKKYPAANNWQMVDNAEERYMDALMRHLEAVRRGEVYDTDNIDPTLSHMSAVAVNALFLLEFMLNPKLAKKGSTDGNVK